MLSINQKIFSDFSELINKLNYERFEMEEIKTQLKHPIFTKEMTIENWGKDLVKKEYENDPLLLQKVKAIYDTVLNRRRRVEEMILKFDALQSTVQNNPELLETFQSKMKEFSLHSTQILNTHKESLNTIHKTLKRVEEYGIFSSSSSSSSSAPPRLSLDQCAEDLLSDLNDKLIEQQRILEMIGDQLASKDSISDTWGQNEVRDQCEFLGCLRQLASLAKSYTDDICSNANVFPCIIKHIPPSESKKQLEFNMDQVKLKADQILPKNQEYRQNLDKMIKDLELSMFQRAEDLLLDLNNKFIEQQRILEVIGDQLASKDSILDTWGQIEVRDQCEFLERLRQLASLAKSHRDDICSNIDAFSYIIEYISESTKQLEPNMDRVKLEANQLLLKNQEYCQNLDKMIKDIEAQSYLV